MSKKETKDKLEKWYRLDNSADIYPMSLSRTTQSNFRLTIALKEFIVPEVLKGALEKTYERYPTFKVHLRKGFFRYYFEENELEAKIFPEGGIFFETIDFKKNNRYLIKVIYYKRRISIDFFHGLTDGTGAFEFAKTLIYYYLLIAGKEVLECLGVKKIGDLRTEGETEDATQKYYVDFPLTDKAISQMTGTNSVYVKGKRFARMGHGTIIGEMDSREIVDLAKKHDCTVTEYMAALALLSLSQAYDIANEKNNLAIMIPLNLRRVFPSSTLSNFTTMIRCELNQKIIPPDINSYIRAIKKELREGVANKELLQKKLSIAALMSEKMYMRLMPSRLKTLFIKVPRTFLVKPRQTLILSNIGIVDFPDCISKEIARTTFHVNISKKTPINIGIVTSNGKMTISFTRMIVSTSIEKEFFTMLAHEGVNIRILSNYREESDALERQGKTLKDMRYTAQKRRRSLVKASRNNHKAK